jgi:hypothetical protein
MREAQYPDVDDRTKAGRAATKTFRDAFIMTDQRDSFGTLEVVDAMLKPFGLEIVTLGDGSDPLFKIDRIET